MATHEDNTVTTNSIESSLFASFQWEIRTRIFVYPGRNTSILKIKFSAPQNSWVSSKMLMSPLRVGVLLKPLSKIKGLNIFQNNLLSERNYGFKYWEIFHSLSFFSNIYCFMIWRMFRTNNVFHRITCIQNMNDSRFKETMFLNNWDIFLVVSSKQMYF